MATVSRPVTSPRAAVWEDFIDIFYTPSAVFARREQGSVWIPLVVVTLLMGGLFFVNSGVMQPIMDAEFERGMASAMRNNPNIPPETMEQARQFTSRIGQIGVFVFVPLGIFFVGCALWVAGKLVEAKQSFHAALVVAAYSFIPRIPEAIVNRLQGLFLDPSQLDGFACRLAQAAFWIPIRRRRSCWQWSGAWISSQSGLRCCSRSDCR